MIKGIFFFLFISLSAQAQISLFQSDSNTEWKEINTENFQVIFPDYLESKAHYSANLLEYYRPLVGKTYDIKPKKLYLILRSNMSEPNGFVSLSPRRSEWFYHENISPVVGALSFYQTLAIHEYRHVAQLDYLARGKTRFGYYLFGSPFLRFLIGIVTPSWYIEGDAVWAETTLSDAGRGRSPRFPARLKALLISGQVPSYDDFIAGDYTNDLPNHYVYGYFLITNAINIYGKKVWKEVAAHASDHPWNPYAFYSAFKYVTGASFEDFYNDTFYLLQKKWAQSDKTPLHSEKASFAEYYFPKNDNNKSYYLKTDLDSHWGLYEDDQLLKSFDIMPSFSKTDLKNGYFIFAQKTLHKRYILKSFYDLFTYQIDSKKIKQISYEKRYYHPQLNNNSTKILVTELDESENFTLNILDIKGNLLQKTPSNSQHSFSEAVWRDDQSIIAITRSKNGKKQIISMTLKDKKIKELTPLSHNNLYNLTSDKGNIYFEADWQGKVNIFSLSLLDNSLSQCTYNDVGAFSPSVKDNQLSFVWEGPNGKRIKKIPLRCLPIKKNALFDYDKYLGSSPSDFFHKSKPVHIKDFTNFLKRDSKSTKHSELDGIFLPHSWSFFGGRGFQLQGKSINKINTLSLNAYTGNSSRENTPFTGLSIDYLKYYPILNLTLDYAKRQHSFFTDQVSKWDELITSTQITLPYIYKKNLYKGTSLLNLNLAHVSASSNDSLSETQLNNDSLLVKSLNLSSSYSKLMTSRELFPEYSYKVSALYTDLSTKNNSRVNYLGQLDLNMNLPGYKKNHAFNLNFNREYKPKDTTLYQFQTKYLYNFGYTFSRGHAYTFTPEFNKYTLEYALPLAYPKTGLKDWIYFNRIWAKVFIDHTRYLSEEDVFHSLNSKGIELTANSYTLRKFHFNYGLRVFQMDREEEFQTEIFFGFASD